MAEMTMSAEAADALEGLYDSGDPIADAVDRWLDAIETDPGAPLVKRRLIRPGTVYAITVRDPRGQQDWLILWELVDNIPVVRYLGHDSLG